MLSRPVPVLRLDNRPEPFRVWFGGLFKHRDVLIALAKQDFRARYKRASFGMLWAVAVPVLQATVMVFIFSKLGRFSSGGFSYGAFVLTGMVVWFYASTSIPSATTGIVDNSHLNEKVWFPRAVPALVPSISNLATLSISIAVVLVVMPILDTSYSARLLLLVPATALLVAFTWGISLVLSAAYVYFRDVKFIVQAGMLMWFYVTPIVYPPAALGSTGEWLDFNPLTGIAGLFQRAVVDAPVPSERALVVAIVTSVALLGLGVMIHRRHDRLFVDQL